MNHENPKEALNTYAPGEREKIKDVLETARLKKKLEDKR